MKHDEATIEQWLNTVRDEGRNLTKWEEDFMDSLYEQWDTRKSISDKQEDILERIYADKTP